MLLSVELTVSGGGGNDTGAGAGAGADAGIGIEIGLTIDLFWASLPSLIHSFHLADWDGGHLGLPLAGDVDLNGSWPAGLGAGSCYCVYGVGNAHNKIKPHQLYT